jgi:hypothetical protein
MAPTSAARPANSATAGRPSVAGSGRFDRFRLETLDDRVSVLRRRRRPTWTIEQLGAVRAFRQTYPGWGKDKLRVLLRRQGIALSVSMIGRILGRLRAGW